MEGKTGDRENCLTKGWRDMAEDIVRFFTKKFDIDIEDAYSKLEKVHTLSVSKLSDRDTMLEALNKHAELEQLAKRLAAKAKRLYQEEMVDYNKAFSKLSRQAVSRLKEWQKEVGIGSRKQITKDDVIGMICEKRDSRIEYRRIEERRLDLEEIRDNCNSLANRWKSRGILLNAQSKVLNAKIEITLGGKKGR